MVCLPAAEVMLGLLLAAACRAACLGNFPVFADGNARDAVRLSLAACDAGPVRVYLRYALAPSYDAVASFGVQPADAPPQSAELQIGPNSSS